ncbi:cytochrome P450 2D6-like [Symsagittifera roscoffensis]|uniref:cytochrome P450 2D6-like n=1 Tax=Symsagittifera roscoffensis TaxID=84072 RepID=UPI00307C2BBB
MSSNIVFNLLFGKTFDYDDPLYLEFYYYLQRVFDFQNPRALHYWLPLCIAKRMSVPKEVISKRKNFIEKLRAEFFRRKPPSLEAARNREPECVSDYLWNKVLIDNDSIITETSAVAIMADLVLTGQETVTNNLCWLLLVMIHYPEVQEKIFQELSSKTDINHPLVSFCTQGDCHYTLATISETMRMYPVVYSTLDHTASEDVDNLHGFRIPKGIRLFGNIVCIYKDKKYWKDV